MTNMPPSLHQIVAGVNDGVDELLNIGRESWKGDADFYRRRLVGQRETRLSRARRSRIMAPCHLACALSLWQPLSWSPSARRALAPRSRGGAPFSATRKE